MRKEKGVYHKTFYCGDVLSCSDGERVFDIFLLADVKYCSNDRGVRWLSMRLEDKSGSMRAKVWSDRMEMEYEGFKGQIVLISGSVTYYAGTPELTVDKMQIAPEGEFELSEVVKTLRKEKIQVYKEEIISMVEKISSNCLREYVTGILNDDVLVRMADLPVHLSGHHTYRGALLEHVCEVITASYYYVKSTQAIRDIKYDLDLVLAGAALHDIGSLVQYRQAGYGFTIDGADKLLGNMYATHAMLDEARTRVPLGADTYGLLLHIIDASHVKEEPMTMEAMIVRRINELSAELEMYESACTTQDRYRSISSDFLWSKELKREISRIRRNDEDGK